MLIASDVFICYCMYSIRLIIDKVQLKFVSGRLLLDCYCYQLVFAVQNLTFMKREITSILFAIYTEFLRLSSTKISISNNLNTNCNDRSQDIDLRLF